MHGEPYSDVYNDARLTQDDFADWLNLSATQQRYGFDYSQAQRILALLNDAGFKRFGRATSQNKV